MYLFIFPGLQRLYKAFVAKEVPKVNAAIPERSPHPNGSGSGLEDFPDQAKSNLSVWNDLTFIIFGSVVYAIAYFIVPLFESEVTLFLCE